MLGFTARLSGTDQLRLCFWSLLEGFPVRRTWELQISCQALSRQGSVSKVALRDLDRWPDLLVGSCEAFPIEVRR